MINPASRAVTLALIERYYVAFNAGDSEGMLACLSDEVAHDINQGARQLGKAAFAAFLAHMDRCYAERLDDIVVMASEDGARAAAEFVVHGQYLATDEGLPEASGQRYVLPAGAFFSVSDGVIARVSVYYNLADWMAQVGA
ncbi:nuclear transport factor 2 family protein [Novosphingobium flavum]|uniref:Nuclear transport factor 2 family protein n=1 Tax=Novosphingobium flavum TaxID=1778672 RepID=A0A7X1KKD4_9SPHN|nr:ketosteroid isomerase-related protein [Novosphingobium flavum]MBC2664065.1 nuclear transport factor 2 family protein [Novosphingobium flavum]